MPLRPANRLEIVIFDIWKEMRRTVVPANRAYMEWFHEMRTGSKEGFEESTRLGFTCLGVVVLIALYIVVKIICIVCRCCCCRQKKQDSVAAAEKTKKEN